jgi:hypothetical protein
MVRPAAPNAATFSHRFDYNNGPSFTEGSSCTSISKEPKRGRLLLALVAFASIAVSISVLIRD